MLSTELSESQKDELLKELTFDFDKQGLTKQVMMLDILYVIGKNTIFKSRWL